MQCRHHPASLVIDLVVTPSYSVPPEQYNSWTPWGILRNAIRRTCFPEGHKDRCVPSPLVTTTPSKIILCSWLFTSAIRLSIVCSYCALYTNLLLKNLHPVHGKF